MNSGGAPKICARPNFWNDMMTSCTSGQPMNTASMMRAGVSSASGAHGNLRRLRAGPGSDGAAAFEVTSGMEIVDMARLLSRGFCRTWGPADMGRGAPHAGRPVMTASAVEDGLDLRVGVLREGRDVTAVGDVDEQVLHDALGLDIRPVRRSRRELGVGRGRGDDLCELGRRGGDLVAQRSERGNEARLREDRLVAVAQHDLERLLGEVGVLRLRGDAHVRAARE